MQACAICQQFHIHYWITLENLRPKKENYLQTVKWPTPCKQCQTCSKVSEAGSNARPTNRPTNWPIDVLTHDWLTQSRSELACMSTMGDKYTTAFLSWSWLFYYWTQTILRHASGTIALRVCVWERERVQSYAMNADVSNVPKHGTVWHVGVTCTHVYCTADIHTCSIMYIMSCNIERDLWIHLCGR